MRQKTTFKERLLEALLELIFGLIFVGVGIGIWVIFGENPWELDFEILALIGMGALAVVALAVGIIVYFIKKRNKK
ncbi:MAG: hypothetical protein IJW38_05250 [Clostridia bacterium]|nr:hypothetical protein [Clostridia bacterium]